MTHKQKKLLMLGVIGIVVLVPLIVGVNVAQQFLPEVLEEPEPEKEPEYG